MAEGVFPASAAQLCRPSPSHYERTAPTTHSVYTEAKLLRTPLIQPRTEPPRVGLYTRSPHTRSVAVLMLCMICQTQQ